MKQIVIAQRGWVFVGDVTKEGQEFVIRNTYCIRRWGTSAGLGELAKKGPTPSTILDPIGTVRVHKLAVVGRIDCEADRWSK